MGIREKLNEEGFVLIENYIPTSIIEDLQKQIQLAFMSKDVIRVNNDGIIISTINGNELLSKSSLASEMYKLTFDLLSDSFFNVFELCDKRIAISANLLNSVNDGFRLHFDRNQITVVLYLSLNPSFPLILYPLVRKDPRVFQSDANKRIDVKCEKKIKIYPKPGLAVVFWGRRTLHGVLCEKTENAEGVTSTPSNDRLSLQFGFDLDKFSYNGESYYGNQK